MVTPDEQLPDIVLLMAAFIASVRTLRFEPKEFKGDEVAKVRVAMHESLTIAQCLYERAHEELR